MENDIVWKENQENSINMIAAFRQKYSDVKRLGFIQVVFTVWVSIALGILALALKSQLITGVLGVAQRDISLYVSFYCIVITLADLFLLNKLIDSGKELAANIQELFDTSVFGISWNSTLAGLKPDAEAIHSLKNKFYKVSTSDFVKNFVHLFNEKRKPTKSDILKNLHIAYDLAKGKKKQKKKIIFIHTHLVDFTKKSQRKIFQMIFHGLAE